MMRRQSEFIYTPADDDLLLFEGDAVHQLDLQAFSEEFPAPPLFPDASFGVGFKRFELNQLLSKKEFIVIKVVHGCCCYLDLNETSPRDPVVLLVQNRGLGIRVKDAIHELILRDYTPECDHNTLTMFKPEGDIMFTAVFHRADDCGD
jgi:hypothetical protein